MRRISSQTQEPHTTGESRGTSIEPDVNNDCQARGL